MLLPKKVPRADSFLDQVFKVNSENVLLKSIKDSVILIPLTKAPQVGSGQAETCYLPAGMRVRHL